MLVIDLVVSDSAIDIYFRGISFKEAREAVPPRKKILLQKKNKANITKCDLKKKKMYK